MKKELRYLNIDNCYGGNQDWFYDSTMKLGGCAAVTACDLCLYLKVYKGYKSLYPFDVEFLKKEEYIKFSNIMKRYLCPRMSGINTLELYIEGFEKYLEDIKDRQMNIKPFYGDELLLNGKNLVLNQINKEIPIPFLLLKHKNEKLSEFVWHWFLIVGYEELCDDFLIKVATYGQYSWISFKELWHTGYEEKGGMIIVKLMEE